MTRARELIDAQPVDTKSNIILAADCDSACTSDCAQSCTTDCSPSDCGGGGASCGCNCANE